jgi:protein-tyrosine phosphatase
MPASPLPDRLIAVPGTLNLRDLGGYQAAGGGTLRWRTLFRSDALHRLDDAGRLMLAGLNLRTVIDLRTHEEAEIAPSALGEAPGLKRSHIPVLSTADFTQLPLEIDAVYGHMADNCGSTITAAIRRLCAPEALPGLIHCSAGKDRTGMLSALILAVLGVSDEDIAADYTLTQTYLLAEPDRAVRQVAASTGLGHRLTLSLMGAPPEAILGALALVRRRSGTVTSYLLSHGLTQPDLDRLRTTLIEPPEPEAS